MSKIVYLFGAGASANALPIVNQVPDRIRTMIAELPNLNANDKSGLPCDQGKLQLILDELKWLLGAIDNHATMDTLAKKLWVQNKHNEYERLKFAIATFFILEQAYGKPDPRYDTFWASMIDGIGLEPPNNISILSWNYDSQFEIAYEGYSSFSDMSDIQLALGIRESVGIEDKFNILKLNGTALLSMDESPINPFRGRTNMNVASYIHALYIDGRDASNIHNPLSFAWAFRKTDSLFPRIESRVKNADILIVIGYSFPFFNRTIDRKIIDSMSNLKKIYFQDKDPDNIAKAFRAISNKSFEIETTSYTDQFFLPPEL